MVPRIFLLRGIYLKEIMEIGRKSTVGLLLSLLCMAFPHLPNSNTDSPCIGHLLFLIILAKTRETYVPFISRSPL